MVANKNGLEDYADLYDLFEEESSDGPVEPTQVSFGIASYLAVILLVSLTLVFSALAIDYKSGDLAVGAPAEGAPPYLIVSMLDVGQGDAIFIRTPDNYTALIDGGDRGTEYSPFDGGRDVVLPFLKQQGIEKIDTMIMSHAHSDHVGGLLEVMENLKVGEVLESGEPYPSGTYKKFLRIVKQKKIKYRKVTDKGFEPVLSWGKHVFAQVLAPKKLSKGTSSDTNNNSVILYMRYGKTSFLFTGDAESELESELIRYGKQLKSTVLKIGHHGSDTASSPRFMKLVNPDYGTIMVGRGNKFGLPSPTVCEEYIEMGTKLLRTDYNGTIIFVSNGEEVRVYKERG